MATGTFSVSLLSEKGVFSSEEELQQYMKTVKPKGRNPYRNETPLVISGLTEAEAKRLMNTALASRQVVHSTLSQFYAWNNPLSGFDLAFKTVSTVGHILNKTDRVKILQLPTGAKKSLGLLPNYERSDVELVRKVYEGVLKKIHEQDPDGRTKPVAFKTFWSDGFVLYRNFVYQFTKLTNCSYKNAVAKCSLLGKSLITSKKLMREAIEIWDKEVRSRIELEPHLANTLLKPEDSDNEEEYEEMCKRLMEKHRHKNKMDLESEQQSESDEDSAYEEVDPAELFPILKLIVRRKLMQEKNKRKSLAPQTTRASTNTSVQNPVESNSGKKRPSNLSLSTKSKKKPKTNPKSKKKKPKKKKQTKKRKKQLPAEESSESGSDSDMESSKGEDSDGDPDLEVPVHDPSDSCDLPEGKEEYLVLEIPYLDSKSIITEEEVKEASDFIKKLIGGHVYAPRGSTEIRMVVFIKIRDTFFYSFERADVTYHGQVDWKEKEEIEARCEKNDIHYTTLKPSHRLDSLLGVNVVHHTSPLYQECFGGMRADPKGAHAYLRKVASDGDKDRNAIMVTMGFANPNSDHTKKTQEELEKRLLDGPSWAGTQRDFDELGPLVKDIIDCSQDMMDKIYTGCNKQCPGQLRCETYAGQLNNRLRCLRNRQENTSVSISYLDPRCNTLFRHCDKENDVRDGYTATSIWSTVFKDTYTVIENGVEVTVTCLVRLSVICYTRKRIGSYMDKVTGYVTVFNTLINKIREDEHYKDINNYSDLDLAELVALGKIQVEGVWPKDMINTIKCIVLPMFFNPCATFSSFAWCISRLRRRWKLKRLQVIELVYLASLQSSTLPFVWTTEKLLREKDKYCQNGIARYGIMQFYHREIKRLSQREGVQGGAFTRHQVVLSYVPGMESEKKQVFTEKSLKKLRADVKKLANIVSGVENHTIQGKQAMEKLRDIDKLGELCWLKFLPLAALVGLLDIEVCFKDALYGETPPKKPHGKALKDMGCVGHLEQKYLQGLNEYMGEPREHAFHADHVLCMAHGYSQHPNRKKWEVFFPGMPLLRFAEDEERRVITILRKEYGKKEWKRYQPHLEWEESADEEEEEETEEEEEEEEGEEGEEEEEGEEAGEEEEESADEEEKEEEDDEEEESADEEEGEKGEEVDEQSAVEEEEKRRKSRRVKRRRRSRK